MLLGVGAKEKTYVDDVFSTYLYKGTGSSLSINNGIDMSKGGLTWLKNRDATAHHYLFDTEHGVYRALSSDRSNGVNYDNTSLTAFNNNGFTLGGDTDVNDDGANFSSWTFRKSPAFTVVNYQGTGSAHTISHDLGSVPGLILIKMTNGSENWRVYHRSLTATHHLLLNESNVANTGTAHFNDTNPTASVFSVGTDDATNQNGKDFIAYLFAGGGSTAATARSVVFDGSGDRLVTNTSSNYAIGTSDFTLEYWFYHDAVDWDWIVSSTNREFETVAGSSGEHQFNTGGTTRITSSSVDYLGAKQWNHIAIVRNSGTTRMYINGTKTGEDYSDSTNYTEQQFTIARRADGSYAFNGKISNFRLVIGTAVYTSPFKPPTEPLTNITNTKLLCCQSSTISAATAGTIGAVEGDPTASADSPFDDLEGFKFGASGNQNVIKTGTYVGNGALVGFKVEVGWEPQYVLIKRTDGADEIWNIFDSMRGISAQENDNRLIANSNANEYTGADRFDLTSTGFRPRNNQTETNASGGTYIWMAIRRPDGYVGKPRTATELFAMAAGTSNSDIPAFVSGFPVDYSFHRAPATSGEWYTQSRLTGTKSLKTAHNSAEAADGDITWDFQNGYYKGTSDLSAYQGWLWRRHAGFDVLTYTGNEVAGRQIPHSLNKIPEMMWVKCRSSAQSWVVYHKGMNGGTNPEQYYARLDSTDGQIDRLSGFNDTAPTSTHFTLGDADRVNGDQEYIAMLFASVNGISKVGSYTGSGASNTQTITTGFQPRFVIIKDYTANSNPWYTMNTTRGWGSGDDKQLMLDDTYQELTNDWGAPTSTGFTVTSNGINLNTNNQKYIYYAHA